MKHVASVFDAAANFVSYPGYVNLPIILLFDVLILRYAFSRRTMTAVLRAHWRHRLRLTDTADAFHGECRYSHIGRRRASAPRRGLSSPSAPRRHQA